MVRMTFWSARTARPRFPGNGRRAWRPKKKRKNPVVTAVEVYSLIEAEIICSLLESQGIPCILQAENQYAVDANYNIGPLARRRILVRQSDLAEARDILRAVPEAESPPER
jgi:hypothetical protein